MEVGLLTGRAGGFVLAAAARDVSLASDNRLNAAALHRVVKRDCAEDVAMVGHGTRGHLQFFNAFRERLDLNGAVNKAVVSMKVEVYELSVLHIFQSHPQITQ